MADHEDTPIYILNEHPAFPPATEAGPDGLLAVGGDLSPERLLNAYASGIFPWFMEEGIVFWFSPDPRMVLHPERLIIPKSLKRMIKSSRFSVRFDTAFRQVIEECSRVPRTGQDGTWIGQEFIEAYCVLHHAGYAHSVEIYSDGKLAGGLYGISLGRVFFGESMFHHVGSASKVALYHLAEKIKTWQFTIIDCQVETPHLLLQGAQMISRSEYLKILVEGLNFPTHRGNWSSSS